MKMVARTIIKIPDKNLIGKAINSTFENTFGDPSPKFIVVERLYFPRKKPDMANENG